MGFHLLRGSTSMVHSLENCRTDRCAVRFTSIGGRTRVAKSHSLHTVSLRAFVTVMADSADSAPAATNPTQVAPKKTKSAAKKPRTKPVHPRTSEMVGNAIKSLKERGGSSLQAIKKYIAANYKVDSEKLSPFIKKYLKTAVASGELVQTKGKGASGSFKLAAAKTEKAAAPAPARGRAASAPKVKKQSAAKVKKAKAPKKAAVKSAEKKRAAPAKAKKAPSKAKKVTKVPTKKPKAPRPKTAAKSKAPKKASPKKK